MRNLLKDINFHEFIIKLTNSVHEMIIHRKQVTQF